MKNLLVIVRGGGDLATGIIHRLVRSGYKTLILETQRPAAIRRQVSFCESIYDGEAVVEGVKAVRIADLTEAEAVWEAGNVPLIADPNGESIAELKPDVVVDAIIAKKNLGTRIDMAPLVIAVGPGFCAGEDVHYVVESKRGHNLGRIISEGYAFPNSGIPGNIGGYTAERVIHASVSGTISNISKIGDVVDKDQIIGHITTESGEQVPINATIPGILRGFIRDGYSFEKGFKIADIDPRISELDNTFTISDKARCIAGSVLELVTAYANKME